MILNNKPTNPGELRTPITLLSRSVSTDAGGFKTVRFTTIVSTWAKWSNVHGAEVWAANMAQADAPATLTIRYRASLDNTIAVCKGAQTLTNAAMSAVVGGVWEVVSLDDIQERHEYIEIKIKRMKAG